MAGNLSGQRTGQFVANAERFHEIARRIRESSSKYVAVAILESFVGEVLNDFVNTHLVNTYPMALTSVSQELGERAAETARIADANLVDSLVPYRSFAVGANDFSITSEPKPLNLIWESNQGRDEYHCARCGDSYTPCKHWAASQFMPGCGWNER